MRYEAQYMVVPEQHYRITDTLTDSRVATCYHPANAELIVRALNAVDGADGGPLTFATLRVASIPRAIRWHINGLDEWNIAEWTNAMAGEAGEACNASKKLRRLQLGMQQRDGDSKVPTTLLEAQRKVGKEVGDTIIHGDIVCHQIGMTTEECVRYAFNQISEREGFPERL